MNSEVRKIKEEGLHDEQILGNRDEKSHVKMDLCYKINQNMSNFYSANERKSYDEYVELIIQNIYMILRTFARVNIYPEGFYNIIKNRKGILLDSKDNPEIEQSIADFYKEISREFSLLKSRREPSNDSNIGNTYDDMRHFYVEHGLEQNNKDLVNDKQYMDRLCFKSSFLTEKFIITDSFDEDIECLMDLMFLYMSFLVEVGYNPKERLNEVIEENKNIKSNKR